MHFFHDRMILCFKHLFIVSLIISRDSFIVLQDSDATECDMKFPPGFEPCRESESSTGLFSGPLAVVHRMLANELYISSKQSLFQHFEEVIAEEIANCLCYGLQSSTDQVS